MNFNKSKPVMSSAGDFADNLEKTLMSAQPPFEGPQELHVPLAQPRSRFAPTKTTPLSQVPDYEELGARYPAKRLQKLTRLQACAEAVDALTFDEMNELSAYVAGKLMEKMQPAEGMAAPTYQLALCLSEWKNTLIEPEEKMSAPGLEPGT